MTFGITIGSDGDLLITVLINEAVDLSFNVSAVHAHNRVLISAQQLVLCLEELNWFRYRRSMPDLKFDSRVFKEFAKGTTVMTFTDKLQAML